MLKSWGSEVTCSRSPCSPEHSEHPGAGCRCGNHRVQSPRVSGSWTQKGDISWKSCCRAGCLLSWEYLETTLWQDGWKWREANQYRKCSPCCCLSLQPAFQEVASVSINYGHLAADKPCWWLAGMKIPTSSALWRHDNLDSCRILWVPEKKQNKPCVAALLGGDAYIWPISVGLVMGTPQRYSRLGMGRFCNVVQPPAWETVSTSAGFMVTEYW